MAGSMAIRADGLAADAPFSYVCHRCRRCCYDKLIQVNPYEVARLARNRGLSTTVFIREHLEPERPYLRRREDGACVFLGPEGCTVHSDRPLVCRVYPLGRHVVAGGAPADARYSVVHGHPESEGEFGTNGTIADYLAGQDIAPFTAAAEAYLDTLQTLFDAWRSAPGTVVDTANHDENKTGAPEDAAADDVPELLDLDRAIDEHCRRNELASPSGLEERMGLHLRIIRDWLAARGHGSG